MTPDPLVPEDRLPPVEGELLRRIAALQPPLAVDVAAGPAGRALAHALAFERWPELIDAGEPLDPLRRFYNRYFWFRRFATLWQAEHGSDAGLEQQVYAILGQAEGDVDWDLVERLDEQAQSG
jgi:hypothetical protein